MRLEHTAICDPVRDRMMLFGGLAAGTILLGDVWAPGTRSGNPIQWQVTSAGGDESVVVIGSLAPLADLEREIARIPAVAIDAPVQYGEVSDQAKQQIYRGIGGVKASPAPAGAPGALGSIIQSLPGGLRRSDDLWVWQIRLVNP